MIVIDDLEMAGELENAVEAGALFLHFQPKLELATGRIDGVEALARWDHPERGAISPAAFIPAAERFGLIDALTEWGLRAALRQWIAWRDQGVTANLAFNLSALSLRDIHFPDHLERLCALEGVPCEHLTLEVTEGATQHTIRLLDTLTRFRLKGLSLALDDFGTGYSSLLQLRQLPYTELKIDQCFVRDAAHSHESRLIVRSIVDLAHALGLTATAEGVEDKETLDLIADLGCDHAQGWHVARPMAGAAFVRWLMERAAQIPAEEARAA